jgi:hypothetical protein
MTNKKYIEYLYYPKIPDGILNSTEEILNLPRLEQGGTAANAGIRSTKSRKIYSQRRVGSELKEWLLQTFEFPFTSYYMICTDLLNSHTDFRKVAINYFLDLGGDDIFTETYDREYIEGDQDRWATMRKDAGLETTYDTHTTDNPIQVLTSELVPLHQWVKYDTSIPHGTVGNIVRPRIFLSVIPHSEIPIPKNEAWASTVIYWRDTW